MEDGGGDPMEELSFALAEGGAEPVTDDVAGTGGPGSAGRT